MFVRFGANGKVAEAFAFPPPANPEQYIEVPDLTFEQTDRARLVDGEVVLVDEAALERERAVQNAEGDLKNSRFQLRARIDLAQSVAELTKKVDIAVLLFHQVVLANKLRDSLSDWDRELYDQTVAVFADQANMMNLQDFDKSIRDITAMHETLVEALKEYHAAKAEIYRKYDLTEQEVKI